MSLLSENLEPIETVVLSDCGISLNQMCSYLYLVETTFCVSLFVVYKRAVIRC